MKKKRQEKILSELEDFIRKQGITLRYERGDFKGGYCVLKEQRLVVVNRRLDTARKISLLAKSIIEMGVDLESLDGKLRDVVENELVKIKLH